MVDQPSQVRDPVELLAEEFLERRRRGELPSLTEYMDRYPHLAEEIRDVFPALVMMDDIDPQSAELNRSLGGRLNLQGRPELRQLGDFRILREIGRGGMGAVYEARQESLGRHVALKVLPPTISRREPVRERFLREARAAARLHHTNIVPVFGTGDDQGVLYYAMQFIQGQGLDAVLEDVKRIRVTASTAGPANQSTMGLSGHEAARGLLTGQFTAALPGPEAKAVSHPVQAPALSGSDTHSGLSDQPEARYYRSIARLGIQAAEALAYAHSQGILHRDIKPSNLLLDSQGTLWITDFGLAKTEEDADLTHSGELVGTLRYMAAERFKGKADVRSDVYALGVTLYEMLALRPPFTGGDRVALMGQITHGPPLALSQLVPLLPRDFETIVQKAMAREPAARYATARELADDLRRFLENRPIKARRSSAAERLRRWCRRNPAVAALGATVFLLLAGLAATSTVSALWLDAERKAAQAAEQEKTEKLFQSLVDQARASRFSQQVGQRFGSLDAIRQAVQIAHERHVTPRIDELRTLAIASLALPDFRTLQEPPLPKSKTLFCWDTDDRFQLFACNDISGQITVHRLSDGKEMARLRYLSGEALLRFSPRGRFLLACGSDRIRVWDLSTSPPSVVLEIGAQWPPCLHPDGRHMVLGAHDNSVKLFDLLSSERPRLLFKSSERAGSPGAFDPTGARLAMVANGRIEIRDTQTWKLLLRLPETEPVSFVAWHPRGNILAVVCEAGPSIHIWDLERQRRLTVLDGCRGGGISTTFTPDGELLVSNGWEGKIRFWNWRTGQQVLRHMAFTNLRFSSDEKLLIDEGGRFKVVEVATGQEYRTLVQQSSREKEVEYGEGAVHAGGRLLAVAMMDGLRLWDLQTGDEVAFGGPSRVVGAAFASPERLVTNGPSGLLLWPVQPPREGVMDWKIGPPRWLRNGSFANLGNRCGQEGRLLAQPIFQGAVVLRLDHPGQQFWLGPQPDVNFASVSPDGQWAATGTHHEPGGIKIWDVGRRALVRDLDVGPSAQCVFSPDGRWLVARGGRAAKILSVGTWDERPLLDFQNVAVFSADSALLALEPVHGVISLLDPVSGQEKARLEDPNQSGAGFVFTPDGTRLLAISNDTHAIHLWDLRLIRQRLAELGLDWDQPPYPASDHPETAPLRVKVDPVDREPHKTIALASLQLALNPFASEAYIERGKAYDRLSDNSSAIANYSIALALMPAGHKGRGDVLLRRSSNFLTLKDPLKARADVQEIAERDLPIPEELAFIAAQECNHFAWEYAIGPEKERDANKALPLIRKAIKLTPEDWMLLNTQGVVYYRLGQYPQAVEWLERSLRESKETAAAFDLFFLAMCHAKLGAADKARDCYDRACRWAEHHAGFQPGWGEELKQFQAEAKEVLAAKPQQR
jgi:eukaryotic-like serine/threonine-protein kinase